MAKSANLFNPLSEEVITESVLKTIWENDEDRKELAENKLSLYKDDYEEIIEAKIKELFEKVNYDRLKYHVNQSQNILKRVINEISTIYKAPVTRTTTDARLQEILDEYNFDVLLKRINRYTNLFNECLIRVGVRFGRLSFDIITPNICSVIQNKLDPTVADAIYYSTSRVNTAKRGYKENIVDYYYWDVAGNYYVFDEHWNIIEVVYDADDPGLMPSPYLDKNWKGEIVGQRFRLPFVVYHRQFPDSDFWDTTSGQDLYNSTVLTGVKLTEMDYHFKFAAFKQMYAIGDSVEVPLNQIMDPQNMLWIKGEGASVGMLDTQAKLKDMQEALMFQINTIINNYGISSDAWTLSVSEMSGRALKIRNRALMELREDQLPLYREKEQELFDLIRIVNNAHAGKMGWKTIGEGAEVETDFGEIDFPEEPEVELRADIERLKIGLISLGEFYMKYNPDITDEKEAEKVIVDNLTKLGEIIKETPEVDDAINAILKLKSGGNAPVPEGEIVE